MRRLLLVSGVFLMKALTRRLRAPGHHASSLLGLGGHYPRRSDLTNNGEPRDEKSKKTPNPAALGSKQKDLGDGKKKKQASGKPEDKVKLQSSRSNLSGSSGSMSSGSSASSLTSFPKRSLLSSENTSASTGLAGNKPELDKSSKAGGDSKERKNKKDSEQQDKKPEQPKEQEKKGNAQKGTSKGASSSPTGSSKKNEAGGTKKSSPQASSNLLDSELIDSEDSGDNISSLRD